MTSYAPFHLIKKDNSFMPHNLQLAFAIGKKHMNDTLELVTLLECVDMLHKWVLLDALEELE